MALIYDLRTRAGVVAYVEETVLRDVRQAFESKGVLHPFGVAFATIVDGRNTNMPHPLVVGAIGMSPRNVKRQLQLTVTKTSSVGCLYVRQDSFELRANASCQSDAIVAQLEHTLVGELLWCADVQGRKLKDFSEALLPGLTVLNVKPTAFMPGKWMN